MLGHFVRNVGPLWLGAGCAELAWGLSPQTDCPGMASKLSWDRSDRLGEAERGRSDGPGQASDRDLGPIYR